MRHSSETTEMVCPLGPSPGAAPSRGSQGGSSLPLSAPGAPGAPWLVTASLHLCSVLNRPPPFSSGRTGHRMQGLPSPGRSHPEMLDDICMDLPSQTEAHLRLFTLGGRLLGTPFTPLRPRPSIYLLHDLGHRTRRALRPRCHVALYREHDPGIAERFSQAPLGVGLCGLHPDPRWGSLRCPLLSRLCAVR